MTPFRINFPMNMPYYVAKRIVMPGMRQCILCPLSLDCLGPRVVLFDSSCRIVVRLWFR